MAAGSVQSGVIVVEHVDLNVCDSDYDLDVMGTLTLERLWALGLVPEVPGLVHMLFFLSSDFCWCW